MVNQVNKRRVAGKKTYDDARQLTIGQVARRIDKFDNFEDPTQTKWERRRQQLRRELAIWRDLSIELMVQHEVLQAWMQERGKDLPNPESLKCTCGLHQKIKADLFAQVRRVLGKKDGKPLVGESWQPGHEQDAA